MSDRSPSRSAYAYLHGFGSGPTAAKGALFARALAAVGVDLALPDLNAPTFATLDHEAILERMDALDTELLARGGNEEPPRWRVIGSSFGGWVAARWASLHPERVERLVLLCPGFDLAERWPSLIGADAFARWRERGFHPFADATGAPVDLHWRFYEQSLAQPASPGVLCPTLIVHGIRDTVVPVESSRRYALARPHVRLVEVEDEHPLFATFEQVLAETLAFFGLPLPPEPRGA